MDMNHRNPLSVAKLATVGAARSAPERVPRLDGCSRRQTPTGRVILAKLPGNASLRGASGGTASSRGEAEESVCRNNQSASVQSAAPETAEAQPLSHDAAAALSRQMKDADDEMRQIFYSFGFATHEHLVRARQLLALSSADCFERFIVDPEPRGRDQYLQALPGLINQARALDQKAAAAYKRYHQELGGPNAEEYQQHFKNIAKSYSNRGLTLPQLIREGIGGLIRAVDKFGHRRKWQFPTYAACWIRQSIRAALPNRPRQASPSTSLATGDQDVSAKQSESPRLQKRQNEP